MKAVVVYESMYGNTHLVADAIGEGLRDRCEVVVVPVEQARAALAGADLVVVGGPTHAHGMTRASTRRAAVDDAAKPSRGLHLDPDAEGEGLREWFDELDRVPPHAAAFDTRFDAPAVLTGRASKGIGKRLRHHGSRLVVDPESFFVNRGNHLEPQEESRARAWGARLGAILAPAASAPAPAPPR